MKAIVHVDKKWGIGKDNSLMFRLPEDMKFFKTHTVGNVVVMGRNTLNSFPNGKPLKDRVNIVLSTTICRDDVFRVADIPQLFEILKGFEDREIYVIGGSQIYKTLLPYCDEVLVTKVEADGDADTFFENLDKNPDFERVFESQPILTNGYEIRFTTYKNLNVKQAVNQ